MTVSVGSSTTIIVTTDPNYESMVEEIFGPVLTVYVYEDHEFVNVLEVCDKASPYALTGSILLRMMLTSRLHSALRFTAETSTSMTSPPVLLSHSNPSGRKSIWDQ